MSIPKSVMKINKNGIQFTSSVDRTAYTMKELTRAALRDTGRYICSKFRKSFYQKFRKRTRRIGKYTQYWVRHKREEIPNLQVGLKPNAFYGMYQEIGTSKQPKMGLLRKSVYENIAEIRNIQAQYLSAIEKEAEALALIKEQEYEGDADS